MFIDDELGLDDKIELVEKIHGSIDFKEEAVSLLKQEKLLCTEIKDAKPLAARVSLPRRIFSLPRRISTAAAALAAAVLVLSAALVLQMGKVDQPVEQAGTLPYRFVIYEPNAGKVELAGSFTGWKKIPLEPRSRSGYWEVTVDLHPGEHVFSYILNGSRKVADPTIPTGQPDDFGGENSILYMESRA